MRLNFPLPHIETIDFGHPLQRRTDIDWDALPALDEYGLDLVQVADEIVAPKMRTLRDRYVTDVGDAGE